MPHKLICSLGSLILALAGAPGLAQPDLEFDARDLARPARAALFRAPGFPTVDAPEIRDEVWSEVLADLPIDVIDSVADLGQKLRLKHFDVLILPHGSAFPVDVWIPIREFVRRGGGLVVLGGAPFHQPVLEQSDGSFQLGVRQPTFAHELLIGPSDVWSRDVEDELGGPLTTQSVDASEWSHDLPDPNTVYALTVRLASKKDLPDEGGSEGHRDAVLRPLVHVVDAGGLPRACPLLEIDRIRGPEAGGRWILAPSDAPLTASVIRHLVERALEGAAQLEARPVHASLEPGEVPSLRVVQRRPFPRRGEAVPKSAEVVVRDNAGVRVFKGRLALTGQPQSRHGEIRVNTAVALAPGLYHAEVTTPDAPWSPTRVTTGFWVRDAELLAAGPMITVSRDWLRRDGKVMPVIGTTYMASDIHRKFLFEPNPHVWDADFALMSRLGINFVRTGLWTAWSRALLNSGAVDEGFLRALDAYVQTAAKHGIVVNYTFFAFLPPAFGAANPYLDPRALEGQREWLTVVARRYRDVGWIHWDLINEPSYAPPEGLWNTLPTGGEVEARAWKEWVRERHGKDPAVLRDRWRDASTLVQNPPAGDELSYAQIRDHRRPRKARDFVLFSQHAVTEWARTLRAILRAAGGDVLVTLGQDEGGTYTRPAQQLHAEAVDYTGVHPWWRNDDLLATGVLTKVPEKPHLFQETGLMRLEDQDGWPWRDPELAAQVIERKFAYAFGSRAAGVIEWAWNINPYQPIDNESVIGFWRPDGTAKPELRIVPELAKFFTKAAPYLDDFEPDSVVAVIPHSRLFMGRPGGAEGFKRLVRVLAERFGVVPIGLSELRLSADRLAAARLILVPSPLVLEDSASEALLAASRAGTKVLVTGVVLGNPYGAIPQALADLGVADPGRPVAFRERSRWAEEGHGWATFDRDLREQIRRSLAASSGAYENGVWHEPLPLEFAREDGPLVSLLAAALDAAGVETQPSESRVMLRLLTAPKAIFAVLVNETAVDAQRRVVVEGRAYDVPVQAGRSRFVLFARWTGRVLAVTSGEDLVRGSDLSEKVQF